jgi:hypothetical protein
VTTKKNSAKKAAAAVNSDALRDLLGYLNFSQGAVSARFRGTLNELFRDEQRAASPEVLRNFLLAELQRLSGSGDAACADPSQADAVIRLTLDELLPAYGKHHADLLGHLSAAHHYSPLLLARMFEATLAARAESGSNNATIIAGTLKRLNDFVGYRPVAVLENGRRSEIYAGERFCPLPLYFSDVGAAVGPYEELIKSTVAFMRTLPDELVSTSHFSIDRMSELSLDMRSHDHLHPVNKRTNYVFGEWDPDEIDTKGFYRRFIVRRLIIDSLIDWIHRDSKTADTERLFDASAVLAGTILMASAISGSGPQTYDSSVSLTSLLPIVARQRDNFYQQLLETAKGERGKRLKKLANESRQPFGHVRHELNMYLSKYGADQVQHRHLSWMFARMGFEQASCEEASVIPCLSARFESEIQSRLVMVPRLVRNGELETARRIVTEVIDLLHRGIECGGLVDPWNILGFQGLFPLFFTREDSIPDSRVEVLLDIMGQIFDACTIAMSEAAATGRKDLHDSVLHDFRKLAEQWDRYATTTVNDLTQVEGMKSVAAATQVARVLAEWRTAGESAGDISFWRQHVEDFDATSSFAQVVTALLDRSDHVAAMGLLMQWLSHAETVPLENGPHSIHRLLHRLMQCICDQPQADARWNNLRRLFAFMEANAGMYWEIPSLGEFAELHKRKRKGDKDAPDDLDLEHLFDADESSDNPFEAAWEDVTYKDSTDDGNASDTMDTGGGPGTTEFEILYRQIEPRLKFLHTVGSLWGIAAVWVSRSAATAAAAADSVAATSTMIVDQKEYLKEWLAAIRGRLQGLSELVREVRDYEIAVSGSGLEGNIEYDIQMQCRLLLMQNALSTTVEFLMAERLIGSLIADEPSGVNDKDSSLDRQLSRMFTAVFAQDLTAAQKCFPALCKELKRRPLLYVPFENGGQPAAILKARMLQSVIRVLLSQLPRLGMLEETFELLQTSLQMERTLRPSGQAVTEFDRLFRIGLSSSVDCILQSAERWKTEPGQRVQAVQKRIQKLLDAYSDLWTRHSGSMRLSIVEDLHDDEFAAEVEEFIETYGEDLFHTRMLTLGNARAILHHGAETLFDELQETVALTQNVKLLEDFESGEIDREDAAEMAEFVYECVVDNFDRFLEYNTTTTHSDYGNRLYCLLDFLRLEALYDRFEWNTIPWQVAHEAMVRSGDLELAAAVEKFVDDESKGIASSFVEELEQLETEYGVRLPALHDHVGECIIGALAQNRMAALVSRACPGIPGQTQADVEANFAALRTEIADFMSKRIGSGIEPPEWMQRLAGELERVQEGRPGALTDSLMDGDFRKMPQRAIDQQLAGIVRRNDAAESGM